MADQHIGERPAFTGPVLDTTQMLLAVAGSNSLGRATASQVKSYIAESFQAIAGASSRSGRDSNGIYTTVEYRRQDTTLSRRSVLSGGTSPAYTTRTDVTYASNGTTVLQTLVFALTYASGELVSEVLA